MEDSNFSMQMVKFPVRAAIEYVLIHLLMMSDGGGYWGHRTCDTDENYQLNARSVLTTYERGRGDRTKWRAETHSQGH